MDRFIEIKTFPKSKRKNIGQWIPVIYAGGKGHWAVITVIPKVLYNVFLFVSLTTLGTFIEFDWLVH